MNNNEVKPFLRWAGGKKWIINHLKNLVTDEYKTYHEPFLGGGSVFLAMNPQNGAILSDSNEDLIQTYNCIKDNPYAVISLLQKMDNTREDYYHIREIEPQDPFERAARFIYLNQTSFNGLYRVNRLGKYNVPYGNRRTNIYDENNLLAVSKRLCNAVLSCVDFELALSQINPGDLVYLDPPYVVAKEDNCFILYNKRLFSLEDQKRLSKCIDKIKDANAFYILSNAKHDTIREIFEKKDDSIISLSRTSLIGGKNAYRGNIEEYLFTNIPRARERLGL